MTEEVLILIPAKAASTRLPKKNMRLLGGKPLLDWAIDTAKESKISKHILVSTEDVSIANHAEYKGTEALIRPEKLAVDPAGVVDVALHAVDVLSKAGRIYKTLIILLPTCPFRTSQDIRDALYLFQKKEAKFLMSVSKYPHTPFAALSIDTNTQLIPFFPEFIGKKSQEMPLAYRANGAIHVLDVSAFQREKSYYAQPLIAYVMPESHSIDIDTEAELQYAEFLLHNQDRLI